MKNEEHLAKNQPVKWEILRPNFERFEKKKKQKARKIRTNLPPDFLRWKPLLI